MKWTETVALPSGSFSRVIELDIEAQILDGTRLKAIGGRILYPKRHFSKGAAWEHLSKDPPQFQYESQTYEPDRPYTSYGQPPKTGRANPYRARHTEDEGGDG